MNYGRLLETIGAFVLGGGVVALAYELARRPPDGSGPRDLATPAISVDMSADPPTRASVVAPDPVVLDDSGRTSEDGRLHRDVAGHYLDYPPIYDPTTFPSALEDDRFDQHAVVTSVAAVVRERPDLGAPILGALRGGTRVRVAGERTYGGGCRPGWHRIHPRGWVCRSAGLVVGDDPPPIEVEFDAPAIDDPLPYEYWRVNEEMTPFFHRLPNFIEQEQADIAGRAWHEAFGREPMPMSPDERPEEVPRVVREYMNAGYYVTKAGEAVRSERRFVRTTRGAFARRYQLARKDPPEFRGQLLAEGDDALPIYFIRRELPLMRRVSEDSDELVRTDEVLERLSTHRFETWFEMGPKAYYEDANGRLMRAYGVAKVERLRRPAGVGPSEHWVHVDLSEQTLVAYDGDRPVFATLVSTGKEPGMTPIGIFRVRIKHIATSMRDQPEQDEAYSIDDVPWTQYFDGSIALHGAFWHAGYGLVRSHGCINLSPSDARWLFGFTEPLLPPGWHAIAPVGTSKKGSPVVVTE